MADSIEQRLISLVVTRMQTIRTANGYETNIGAKVADSRPNWSEEDDLANGATSVWQGTVTPDPTQSDDEQITVIRKMPVMIKVALKRGTDVSEARKVIKDIYAAVNTDRVWEDSGTPLARQTLEVSHDIVQPEGTFEITGVEVIFEIQYLTHYLSMD